MTARVDLMRWLGLPVLLGAAIVSLLNCRSVEDENTNDLSLIWISLDTLRADHLGAHGYHRDTSPFMDSLARRGLYFDWVVSPQNSTLPSHLTMFTGIHPMVHGIYHHLKRPGLRLGSSVPTLPKVLSEAGFRTLARVDGGNMRGTFGFADGFDSYDDVRGPLPKKLQNVLSDLDALVPGERFFYLIHTFEIHAPYEPPPSHDKLYAGSDLEDDVQLALDQYDASIRFVDDELRRFVAELEARDLLSSTILVITSDHGESFGEYGIPDVGHTGNNLHQNITRVPWILLHPELQYRGRIEDRVGLIDFPNTILALLGIAERFPGGGRDVLASRSAEGEYLSWTGEGAFSLYTGEHHLLWSETYPGEERNGLFRVTTDPLEQAPIQDVERRDAVAERLLSMVELLRAEEQRTGSDLRQSYELDERTRRELRALGYVP